MGTNYYLKKNICHCCNRPESELHIGKSSGGWCFALHIIPEDDINSLGDWMSLFNEENSKIFDEYGREVAVSKLMKIITERKSFDGVGSFPNRWYASFEDMLEKNDALAGPHGLLRRKIGHDVIGHGDGTWDYVIGEFS